MASCWSQLQRGNFWHLLDDRGPLDLRSWLPKGQGGLLGLLVVVQSLGSDCCCSQDEWWLSDIVLVEIVLTSVWKYHDVATRIAMISYQYYRYAATTMSDVFTTVVTVLRLQTSVSVMMIAKVMRSVIRIVCARHRKMASSLLLRKMPTELRNERQGLKEQLSACPHLQASKNPCQILVQSHHLDKECHKVDRTTAQ